MNSTSKRKASFKIEAALSEIVKLRQREALVDLLFRPGALELDDDEVMSGAWR